MNLSILHQNIIKLKIVPGIGNRTILAILGDIPDFSNVAVKFEYIKHILNEKQKESFRNHSGNLDSKLDLVVKNVEKNNITLISTKDNDYPDALKRIYDPPAIIFCKGDINYHFTKSIAVVGTRKSTSYGEKICSDFVGKLAERKFCIVSGLAAGIDTIAHRIAMNNQAKCIGVIGHGFDHVFPSSNKRFYEEVLESGGGIISECLPYEEPLAHNFPLRNRIIAGLAKSTLVVEAAIKSGSMITAKAAFSENRDVYAVPADLYRFSQQGCNELIKLHIAKMVTSVDDILSDYGAKDRKVSDDAVVLQNFAQEYQSILKLISSEKLSTDEISRLLKMDVRNVSQLLTELELAAAITKDEQMKWGLA